MTFEFDRYINGQLMAEGVTIERQGNLPDAMREAARIASRGPNGEVPVLVLRAEALSRTGAVKVKALEWEERKTRLGTVWWRAPNPLGGLSIEAASENDKIAAQADFEHRILSALEPAAPEGQQEPVAYRVHAPEDEYYGTGPDRLQFHPLSQHDLDYGYRQTPLYTRPSEQAVTEALVERMCRTPFIEGFTPTTDEWQRCETVQDQYDLMKRRIREGMAALKAAMEAGR